MNQFISLSLIFSLIICFTLNTKVLFDCYLNKGQNDEIRLGFSHHNYVFSNSSDRKRDIAIYSVVGLHDQESKNGKVTHTSLAEVSFYGEGMNIIHFIQDGKKVEHYLGNYVSRKFRAYIMKVKLLDPTEKYRKPKDVPIADLLNKSLYYKGELPTFTFDIDKSTYEATCDIQDVETLQSVQTEVSSQLAVNNVQPDQTVLSNQTVQTNQTGQISVQGVHQPPSPMNQNFII